MKYDRNILKLHTIPRFQIYLCKCIYYNIVNYWGRDQIIILKTNNRISKHITCFNHICVNHQNNDKKLNFDYCNT